MGLDISAFDDILKIDYLPPIRDAINQDTALYDYLEDGNEFISGKHAYIPRHTGRNEGIGARAESGTLPTAGNQVYGSATYGMRYMYARIQVTGPSMYSSRDDEGAFGQALDLEIQGITKDMRNEHNRMYWGWGDGVLAVPAGNYSNVKTVTVSTGAPGYNRKFLRANMTCDLLNYVDGAGSGNQVDNKIVSGADADGVIVFTNAVTVSTTTGIYRADSRNIEPYGLGALIDNTDPDERFSASTKTGVTDVGGLDRASNEDWQAQVLSNGGTNRELTVDLLQEGLDEVEINSNGYVICMFTSYAIRRKYANILIVDRRFPEASGNPRDFDGAYNAKSLEFNNIPIKVDKFAHPNRIYGISGGNIHQFLWSDFDWMDDDGAILNRVSNKDAYEATLFKYVELGTSNGNENIVWKDISS